MAQLRKSFSIVRKDASRRVLYGWASVSSVRKSDGSFAPYRDLQGDWLPDDVMEDMAWSYCRDSRATKAMHSGDEVGYCVASMPLTEEVQKAFGIACDRTGWLVAMKITDPATWDRFVKNEFSGLSIGGYAEFETEA
jgi:hypothetical protein